MIRILLLPLLVMLAALSVDAAWPERLADGEPMPSLAPIMERVTPAVVNISTRARVEVRNPLFDDPFFRHFFNVPDEQRYRQTRSAGSGVIVDADNGYVLTNDHVVGYADQIEVTLADGRTLEARLVGSDAMVDLAVLQVDAGALEAQAAFADALVAAEFGDSAALSVGDFVVAIGNPFGLGQTVTSGIVSAIGRGGLGVEGYEDFIQTDASINPGNSGGALVNLRGELVGVNTAIIAPSGGNVGIGFAIPANMAQVVMAELIEHGEVRRGHLGLSVQALNLELVQAFGIDTRSGVVVTEVEPDSPAAAAGLRPGDVVTRLGDRSVRTPTDFRARAAVVMVGDTVEVAFRRGGERRQEALMVPAHQYEQVPGRRLHPRLEGVTLQDQRADDPDDGAGVVLLEVREGSGPWRLGLRANDVIVAVEDQQTRNLSELTRALKRNARQPVLRVQRDGQHGQVRLR